MSKVRTLFAKLLAGSVIGGIAALLICYSKAIRAAHQRLDSFGSQVIETAYGQVEFKEVGSGYPVLIIHGAIGGFDQGLWLAQAFGLSRYRLISISRFGHLRSPVPPGANLNMQADAIAALLDALHIQQVVVYAISGGSTAAIRFVARYPRCVSAFILLGPDAPGKAQIPLPPRFIFDTLLRSDFVFWTIITFFGKWVPYWIGMVPKRHLLTPEQQAQIQSLMAGAQPVSRRINGMIFETYTCRQEFKQSVTSASPYPLNHIQTPTLVINAADDSLAIPENVRALASQMPNARLFVVPDGGHFLFGRAEEVKVEMAQFLREQFLSSHAAELVSERSKQGVKAVPSSVP